MKTFSIAFLRLAIVAITLAVMAICTVLLPSLWGDVKSEFPSYSYAVYTVFGVMYIAAIPFVLGMYKAWQLLSNISKNRAFSASSVAHVRVIALCAAIISLVYIVGMPFFYIWADRDDAPGLVVIGLVLVGAPMVVSVFAGLLHRLMSEAVELKSENELTV